MKRAAVGLVRPLVGGCVGVGLTLIVAACTYLTFDLMSFTFLRLIMYPFITVFLLPGKFIVYTLITGDNARPIDFWRLDLPICCFLNGAAGAFFLESIGRWKERQR